MPHVVPQAKGEAVLVDPAGRHAVRAARYAALVRRLAALNTLALNTLDCDAVRQLLAAAAAEATGDPDC